MSTMEIPSLSRELTNDKISMPYPHIFVMDTTDALPLIVPRLPKGDLPVVCEFNNTLRQIGSIQKSALQISKLMRVSRIQFVKAKGDSVLLKNPIDALEVFV